MNQTTSPIDRRVVLKLNGSMAFEALILNRLSRLPEARRQEWLRGLLVQGFRRECRGLRKLQRSLATSYDVPLSAKDGAAPRSVTDTTVVREGTTVPLAESSDSKSHAARGPVSLAALRNVIG